MNLVSWIAIDALRAAIKQPFFLRAAGRNSVASSRAAGDGVNRYSIMVYYTPQFAAVKADREAFVAQVGQEFQVS